MEQLPLFLSSHSCIMESGIKEDKTMRIYLDDNKQELATVICNKCKKELVVENGILKEGCFCGNSQFGYFSQKDGKKHLSIFAE